MATKDRARLCQDQPPPLAQEQLLAQKRLKLGQRSRQGRLRQPLTPRDSRQAAIGGDIQKSAHMAQLDPRMYSALVMDDGPLCIIYCGFLCYTMPEM